MCNVTPRCSSGKFWTRLPSSLTIEVGFVSSVRIWVLKCPWLLFFVEIPWFIQCLHPIFLLFGRGRPQFGTHLLLGDPTSKLTCWMVFMSGGRELDRWWRPSGNDQHGYWTWPFLVDFLIENDDFTKLCNKLPEDVSWIWDMDMYGEVKPLSAAMVSRGGLIWYEMVSAPAPSDSFWVSVLEAASAFLLYDLFFKRWGSPTSTCITWVPVLGSSCDGDEKMAEAELLLQLGAELAHRMC